jgi:hypothetical protein
MIEGDHAVYLGTREVQAFCHDGNGAGGHKPERRLNSMQHFQERSGTPLMLGQDAPHYGLFGRR